MDMLTCIRKFSPYSMLTLVLLFLVAELTGLCVGLIQYRVHATVPVFQPFSSQSRSRAVWSGAVSRRRGVVRWMEDAVHGISFWGTVTCPCKEKDVEHGDSQTTETSPACVFLKTHRINSIRQQNRINKATVSEQYREGETASQNIQSTREFPRFSQSVGVNTKLKNSSRVRTSEREQCYKNSVSSWRDSTLAFLKAQGISINSRTI